MSRRRPWSLVQNFLNGPQPRLRVKSGTRSLDRLTAIAVGEMLKGDSRSRDELANDMSLLSGEQISKFMLDAYASPAREDHPIPAHRLLILADMTGRWDLLDQLLGEFGYHLLAPRDGKILELGILQEKKMQLKQLIQSRFDDNE